MIKQRQELVELYDKGGRPELAAQEREEIAIISAYLPKQMSDDEVDGGDRQAAIARDRRRRHEGHGQGDRRAEGQSYAGQMDFAKASGLVKAAAADQARSVSTASAGTCEERP